MPENIQVNALDVAPAASFSELLERVFNPEMPHDLLTSEQDLPATAEKDPIQNFAAHAQHVLKKGDYLDHESRHFYAQRAAYLIGGAAISLVTYNKDAGYAATAIQAAEWGLGVSALDAAWSWARSQGKLSSEQKQNAKALPGENYELYRVKNTVTDEHELVMHWQGSEPQKNQDGTASDADLAISLETIALASEVASVKAILVNEYTLHDLGNAAAFASDRVDYQNWVQKKKATKPVMRGADGHELPATELLVFTPQDMGRLADYAYDYKNARASEYSQESTINAIRSKDPEHPLVRIYDDAPDKIAVWDTVRRAAVRAVERRLDDVDFERADLVHNGPTKQAKHLQGSLRQDGVVEWTHGGKFDHLQPAEAAVSMTLDEAADIVHNQDVYASQEVIKAAEFLLAASYMPVEQAETNAQLTPHTIDNNLEYTLATRRNFRRFFASTNFKNKNIGAEISHRGKHSSKYIAAAMLGVITVLPLADKALHNEKETTIAHSIKAFAKRHKTKPSNLNDAQKKYATHRAEVRHPHLFDAVDASDNTQEFISTSWDKLQTFKFGSSDAEPDRIPIFTSMKSGMGNVNAKDNYPVWTIDMPTNFSTSGFWAESVPNYYHDEGWDSINKIVTSREVLPIKPEKTDDLIHVSGRVGVDQYSAIWWVPVLEGTKVVAMDAEDKPVISRVMQDGTYTFQMANQSDEAHLKIDGFNRPVSYWLKKDTNAPHTQYNPLNYMMEKDINSAYGGLYRQKIRQAWNEQLGVDNSLTPQQRLDKEVDYIKNNFTYSYTPVNEDLAQKMRDDILPPSAFVKAQLKDGEANCNVASFLVAADNPEVRPRVGFQNNGDHVLNSLELHMQLVDQDGTVYDPTPSRSVSEADGAIVDERSNNNLGNALKFGGIGLLALGGAYGSRKFTPKIMSRAALWPRSRKAFAETLETANNVLFARKFTVPEVEARGVPVKDGYVRQLASPVYHAESTQELMKTAAQNGTRAERRAIKKASRMLRDIKNTQTIQHPVDSANISSIL